MCVDVDLQARDESSGVELRITEIIAPGQVFMPFHFAETNVNQVTQSAFDPISREPNYKQCAVRVERTQVNCRHVRGQGILRAQTPLGEGQRAMNKLVVVGNGMAGIGCVEQILKHAPKFEITIFGDETHVNYNRIMLSSVLAGEKSADDIVLNGLEWYKQNEIRVATGSAHHGRRCGTEDRHR